MLTGTQLGAAIETARKKKGVTKKALAEHFGVTPPSVQDWVNRGTIDKEKLPALWAYFSDVVDLDHWGLDGAGPTITPPDLTHAVPVVIDALVRLSPSRWLSVRAQLDAAACRPEMRDDAITELLPLLKAPSQKQRGAGT